MNEMFTAIASLGQRTEYPLGEKALRTLGKHCGLHRGKRVLDLGCGRGELLCQWAKAFDIQGTGVDEDETHLRAALERASELDTWQRLNLVEDDVLDYPQPFHQYDAVVCLASTGRHETLTETRDWMRPSLDDRRGGLLLMGLTYWREKPTPEICEMLDWPAEALPTIGDIAMQLTDSEVFLRDMHLVSLAQMDAHYAHQWRACARWLQKNPDHEDVPALRSWLSASQQRYLRYEREALGWGVFVLQVGRTE
jgi:cyclopropane fatty-acyl-phospholipid synthase-like methyltransferase